MSEPKSKKMECTIRRYSPNDYESVKILIQGLSKDYNDVFDESIFKANIQNFLLNPAFMIVIAEVNKKACGVALADTDRDPRGVLFGRISNVMILPEAQGKGIGGALVDKAIGFLTNLETPSIWANINPKNDHMIQLFEHRNFRRMLKVMEKTTDLKNTSPQVPLEKGSVKFRLIEEKDIPYVMGLINTLSDLLNEGFDPYWFDLTVRKNLHDSTSRIFIAEENSVILGSVFVDVTQDPAGNSRGYISNVMINKAARGKGIGSHLLLLASEYCEKIKMQKIWANVIYENQQLQQLFEKLGFTIKFTVMVRRAKFYNVAFFDAVTN